MKMIKNKNQLECIQSKAIAGLRLPAAAVLSVRPSASLFTRPSARLFAGLYACFLLWQTCLMPIHVQAAASAGRTLADSQTQADSQTMADGQTQADSQTMADGQTQADGQTMANGQLVADGIYKLISAADNEFVWDIDQAGTEDGVSLQLYEDNNTNAQKFMFTHEGNGCYTITNINSEKALEAVYDDASGNTWIRQSSVQDTDAQRWKLEAAPNGYYTLSCKWNGQAAEIWGGEARNESMLITALPEHKPAQLFRLVETEENDDASGSQISARHPRKFFYLAACLAIGAETAVAAAAGYYMQSARRNPNTAKDSRK